VARYLESLDELMDAMRGAQQAAAREDEQAMAPGLVAARSSV